MSVYRPNPRHLMATHNVQEMLDGVQLQLALSAHYYAAASITALRMAMAAVTYTVCTRAVNYSAATASVRECAYLIMVQYQLVPDTGRNHLIPDDEDIPF